MIVHGPYQIAIATLISIAVFLNFLLVDLVTVPILISFFSCKHELLQLYVGGDKSESQEISGPCFR